MLEAFENASPDERRSFNQRSTNEKARWDPGSTLNVSSRLLSEVRPFDEYLDTGVPSNEWKDAHVQVHKKLILGEEVKLSIQKTPSQGSPSTKITLYDSFHETPGIRQSIEDICEKLEEKLRRTPPSIQRLSNLQDPSIWTHFIRALVNQVLIELTILAHSSTNLGELYIHCQYKREALECRLRRIRPGRNDTFIVSC